MAKIPSGNSKPVLDIYYGLKKPFLVKIPNENPKLILEIFCTTPERLEKISEREKADP